MSSPELSKEKSNVNQVVVALSDALVSGPKTLLAKWLFPKCWNGCQSLVLEAERDRAVAMVQQLNEENQLLFDRVTRLEFQNCELEGTVDSLRDKLERKL